MGATNHTPNIALPQFVDADKPTWRGDVNGAFTDIDGKFGEVDGSLAGKASATAVAGLVSRIVRGSFTSQALTDGSDQSSTIIAELAALYAAGGGNYYLPVGTVRVNSQIIMPHDASIIWKQPTINIFGVGNRQGGGLSEGLDVASGGSVLDLRYAGADAKILTLGRGSLTFTDVTFTDGGTSTTPFILCTNTSLNMRDCTFIGNPSKYGATCDQDAIILGGTSNPVTYGNLVTSGFQGYGTKFDGLRFSRIRRGFYARESCNSVTFDNNVWGIDCGGQTAMEFDGTADQCRANTGTGNLIEMTNYLYGMTFLNAGSNAFFGTGFWDLGGSTIACVRLLGNGSNGNEFYGTFAGTVENVLGQTYVMSGSNIVDGSPVFNILWARHVKASGTGSGQDVLLQLSRSWAETLEPNTNICTINDKASMILAAPTGSTPALAFNHKTDGTLTINQGQIVRSSGDVSIYAGGASTDRVNIARGGLVVPHGTTANRTAPNGAPGCHYFDTTINKPIWTNSSGGWVDANGTAV